MSSPKLLVQILIVGSQILGKAFLAAGRQAVKNAKQTPQALGADVAGVGNATSGSLTDKLTREHRMTLDEAQLILNVKRGDGIESIMKHYEHLFKANSPPPPPPKGTPPPTGRQAPIPTHSHYLQSKVVRARERIEAELKIAEEPAPAAEAGSNPNPPPPPGSS
ncbi:hypothetical protein PLICRDRAFT_50668 [Plicaturopsis crispa FD-325 SS-3]|nr:hypothetical protein PLICRDRAFT_50668 [Plicaturopsis crispa FD-325 SS-3]